MPSQILTVARATGAYKMSEKEDILTCDTTAGAFTATVPSAFRCSGQNKTLKLIGANTLTIAGTIATATASITTTVLTVATPIGGIFTPGMLLTGTGVTAGTTILSQTSPTTFTISASQSVASTTITGQDLIDAAVSLVLNSQYTSATLQSDSQQWWLIGRY